MSYRAVIFDLFGTVVHFRRGPDPGFAWLREPYAAAGLGVPFDGFREALLAVSAELVARRTPEYCEVPSGQRFARALERVGIADPAVASALAAAHMRFLADQVVLPPGHGELLAALASRLRLALVSNFDHAPTAQAILARHGVHRHFDVTLISDDFGRRKPHPAIFHEAIARLGCAPAEVLVVGDTHAEDVAGAHAAGLPVAWIAHPDAADRDPAPTHRIASLTELTRLLG